MPVLRPELPASRELLPYLERIDAARIYTNWGPLVRELEGRLAARFGLPAGGVVSAASGTAALVGAILAAAGRAGGRRRLAILPALTFVATATAAEQCGYEPYLADVDPRTWMLDPALLARGVRLLRTTGVVIPVAPFGRAVPQGPWRAFRARTGIPVVVDGAASFDTLLDGPVEHLGDVPVALSFHATKSFASGEGGCVATCDTDLAERVTQALNFGFRTSRDAEIAHTNGKLSEYHAAVGLAELDRWHLKGAALRAVVRMYRRALAVYGLAGRLVAFPDIGLSYVLLRCRTAVEGRCVEAGLVSMGVDCRFWYGRGLHRQSYFSGRRRAPLSVTDALAPRLIGLPLAPDLSSADIQRVARALAHILRRGDPD